MPVTTADSTTATKLTTLQRTLTSALNELGLDPALVAIQVDEAGAFVPQVTRGFTPRDAQAVLRAVSTMRLGEPHDGTTRAGDNGDLALRLKIISPTARSLLGIPLRYKDRAYGVLVVGRKESAGFSKKERATLESAAAEITKSLERASLFDQSVIWRRGLVSREPVASQSLEPFVAPTPYATPDMQHRALTLLNEAAQSLAFDRAWMTAYDPIGGVVEVLAIAGESKGDKKDLKPGQRIALESSASGWAVRHRKPRLDHDLASTQGRFLDHKHLYKDGFLSAMVMPFFVRGQVGGTVTLASKQPMQYSLADFRALEPLLGKFAELMQTPTAPVAAAPSGTTTDVQPPGAAAGPSEPMIRKQERQAALGEFSAFLATEIREPLASIRAQLEEVTSPGVLDFDSQTRVENAMRDLIRVEAILHEILDFAKPLELNRRIHRITEVIESALTLVATDIDVNRIVLTKDYPTFVNPVRCDEGKMQQAFLSIFKNAMEAMTPGGHLTIEVTQPRGTRQVQITIKNDGVPIPMEHVGKVFEPYFTTKRAGTGLGLATVKKIVEEHQGHISIASGPGQGTAVIIRLPAQQRPPYRGRGRGRRPQRRR